MGNLICCCLSQREKDIDDMKGNMYDIKEDINTTYDDINNIKENIDISLNDIKQIKSDIKSKIFFIF